jgi:hypothetical protein
MPKYPNVTVDLNRVSGNAFSIMGAVTRALRSNGIGSSEQDAYRKEAMSGDYNNLMDVTAKWVNIECDVDDYEDEDEYDDDDDE